MYHNQHTHKLSFLYSIGTASNSIEELYQILKVSDLQLYKGTTSDSEGIDLQLYKGTTSDSEGIDLQLYRVGGLSDLQRYRGNIPVKTSGMRPQTL